jgi:hypothetical protein
MNTRDLNSPGVLDFDKDSAPADRSFRAINELSLGLSQI